MRIHEPSLICGTVATLVLLLIGIAWVTAPRTFPPAYISCPDEIPDSMRRRYGSRL